MDENTEWLSTQAVVGSDDQSVNENEESSYYGCIVLNNVGDIERYVLNKGDNTIGRHPLNNIFIEHPSVSMNHAVIQCDSDGVVLLDKGSLNKTKLNKKSLKANVAYFLDENALLMFGEVQANFYIDGEPACNETSVQKTTEKDYFSKQKMSNEVIISNVPTQMLDTTATCNASLGNENNFSNIIETIISKTVSGLSCIENSSSSINFELNPSSPSDELLLEALTQIETVENDDVKFSEAINNISREDTPSPVMNLGNSLSGDITSSSNNQETKTFIFSTNTEDTREDTPSPTMDLGIFSGFKSGTTILETNNHSILLGNESTNKVDELEDTQLLEFSTVKSSNKITTQLPKPLSNLTNFASLNENKNHTVTLIASDELKTPKKTINTFEADDDDIFSTFIQEEFLSQSHNYTSSMDNNFFNCPTQKISISKNNISTSKISASTKREDKTHNTSKLVLSKKINSQNSSVQPDVNQVPKINDDDFFNCPTQKVSISKIDLKTKTFASENKKETKKSYTELSLEIKANTSTLNTHENETQFSKLDDIDFFNCPTQKVVTSNEVDSKPKMSSNLHEEETQKIAGVHQGNQSIVSKHEDLTQLPEIDDDDFFNCPTQKVCISKKTTLEPFVSLNLHEEETQQIVGVSHECKTNISTSNNHEDSTQLPENDDDDFFNCPTQKVCISKKTTMKPCVLFDELEEKTLQIVGVPHVSKTNINTSSNHEDSTQLPVIDDDDFFNFPTQKVCISKKTLLKSCVSFISHEEETQKLSKTIQGNEKNPIILNEHENETQLSILDENDIFNCPTQKVVTSNKIVSESKTSSNFHEVETQQIFGVFPRESKVNRNTTSKGKDLTQIPEIDDDFFNCPTQKVCISKKTTLKPCVSFNKHEDETQKLPVIVQKNTSTLNAHENKTQFSKLDDNDFFNCPTQNIVISNKVDSKSKISFNFYEKETQQITGIHLRSEANRSISGKHKNSTQPPKIDDDFFNCPTQKILISKKTTLDSGYYFTKHEEETQRLPVTNQENTSMLNAHENETQFSKLDDNDFFNCPTQKVVTSNNVDSKPKISSNFYEEETQQIIGVHQESKTISSISSKHENSIQPPEKDDDFFNCPTQKILISKKNILKPSVYFTKHEEETQRLAETTQENETNPSTLSVQEIETHHPKLDDDDIFNCPTQKVVTSKRIDSKPKMSSNFYEEETQQIAGVHLGRKTNGSTSSKHENSTQLPVIDDDDFFNCPTQKVLISKKAILKPGVSFTKHKEDTQLLSETNQGNETSPRILNDDENETQLTKLDDDDIFNCSTQKVVTFNCTDPKPKIASDFHEKETQKLFGVLQGNKTNKSMSSMHEGLTQVPEINNANIFNCPTQKMAISNKIDSNLRVSSKVVEEEIQKFSNNCSGKTNENRSTQSNVAHTSSTVDPDIEDEDFFNCPTQKIIPKKVNPKMSSTKHKEESELSLTSRTSVGTTDSCTSNILENLTQILKTNNEDFFSFPAQKVLDSIKNNSNTNESSTTEVKTQELPELQTNADTSKAFVTHINKDVVQVSEMSDIDFFNCPTQNVSVCTGTKLFIDRTKQETIVGINDAETQDVVSLQSNLTLLNSNVHSPNRRKQIKRNDLDFSVQTNVPIQTLSNSILNKSDNTSGYKIAVENNGKCLRSTSQKQEVVSGNTGNYKLRKSTSLDSSAITKLNAQHLVISNETTIVSKSPKINKKPVICVRKDLHTSGLINLRNKSLDNTSNLISDVPTIPTTKRINSPRCSKVLTNKNKDLKRVVSFKQESLTEDSEENQNVQHKRLSNHLNETIFSPLNVPNAEPCSTSTVVENTNDLSNSGPSTSSNDVSKWKLFWNTKKMSSQNSTNVSVGKKDRYQTRSINKRENTVDLSRKRKQDNVKMEESSKKICNRDKKQISIPSTNSTPEVVVSFSYLRNRHLQEMKQFVDKTGGFVTDDITECSVLVTDKIRCTMKILSAIARGCPIVDANWLRHSYTVKVFQDMNDFIILDKDAERKYQFRLKESLARAQNNRLLEGYTVLVTPSVKPGPKDMKVIITCSGGNYVMNWPKTKVQNELIVTCKQDRQRWKPIWDNNTAKIIDEDTLVMSVIRQKLNV